MSSYRRELLAESDFADLPAGLINHITEDEVEDVKINYLYPTIIEEPHPREPKRLFPLQKKQIRLPARINNPLIPYPPIVRDYIRTGIEGTAEKIHSHHHSNLKILKDTMEKCFSIEYWKSKSLTFNINDLKKIAKSKFSKRTDAINLAALAFAKTATKYDLSITADTEINFQPTKNMISPYMSFLTMIHRLRVMITSHGDKVGVKLENISVVADEASFIYYSNGSYAYVADCEDYRYALVSAGGHFRFFHSSIGKWFCGTSTYLDYTFTVADILNNMDIISASREYSWASEFLDLTIETASLDTKHNLLVDFMKSMEGLLLNLSDYDESYAMNWRPISEAVYDLWNLDKKITGEVYSISLVFKMISGKNIRPQGKSLLLRMIHSSKKLNRSRMQELSALHKFIFYAEVDSLAGVKKFLKRVHTKRPYDNNSIKNITRLAKQLFTISYHRKHSSPPNFRGMDVKIKMLEIYLNRGDIHQVESLPLSWWDDITIFNCMDNTLTNDALEFAKDKGALKNEIRLGPGDSRKELLQVIEQKDYKLTDFFRNAPFVAKPQKIIRTNQRKQPIQTNHPVRLIEKEREQKIEARLFANGKLEDKHSLSLVTTQMKKALSYFDEQLMTPTDKKRKELIHNAAQLLSNDNNYSLLLDIEGHNQSMQYGNTSELAEFLGLLFGQEGWGTLPDYFSQIDLYHYDEFIDDVILSTGQYGGVEGWLNPMWTLHTTLMMKLIRIMTDITMPVIMVYSDDVNSIVEIKQATESTVQAVFNKIISHCMSFGMIVKFSQTNLSKHRVTMLRQHYSDGERADSTLKKLISTSAANNPMLYSDEVEASGICSSIASALELSNHSETCAYLKNYKLGLLLVRLPHMMLSQSTDNSILSSEFFPNSLNSLMYYLKDDKTFLLGGDISSTISRMKNDVASYLGIRPTNLNNNLFNNMIMKVYGSSIKDERFIDSPDRMLYLQIYDRFIQDLLFFWTYLPSSIGGIGASLQLNLILSGHSSGFAKSIHYLHRWIINFSGNKKFFLKYLEICLSVDQTKDQNKKESRALLSNWPNDISICTANTSIQQSIKSMVKFRTVNTEVLRLLELDDDKPFLQDDIINIFRTDFHPRVAQFYYENTSVHFIDLLISKIETSSGLLTYVKNLVKLRSSLSFRTIENLRMGSRIGKTSYGELSTLTDTVDYLLERKKLMFSNISFVDAEEILYDNRITEVQKKPYILTIRHCSPKHYKDGKLVFDTPHIGNEARYKGEYMDDDRMLGNKEEFLAAKLVAVTKWFLLKQGLNDLSTNTNWNYNCVVACNIALATLTGQTFHQLQLHTPTEIGGEILHRIPNIKFSTSTYIRAEMNLSLQYSSELNQELITTRDLIDSNINFDYLRMRYIVAAMTRDKYEDKKRLIIRYNLTDITGVKDVQFIKPKITAYKSNHTYICYGQYRNHNFSLMRFRYMSAAYLNTESTADMALIPNLDLKGTILQVGVEFMNDLIYRYARSLDRDYMRIMPEFIDLRLWQPLLIRLKGLDSKFNEYDNEAWIIYIRNSLTYILNNRRRITTVSKSDHVRLTLQSQCIESLKEYRPMDREFTELNGFMMSALVGSRNSSEIYKRIERYQMYLSQIQEHKRQLATVMIIEYILLFHFHTLNDGGAMYLDVNSCMDAIKQEGLRIMSTIVLCPELHTQILILGADFVGETLFSNFENIKDILTEITTDNVLSDIILPGKLPSLKTSTELTGDELIPAHVDEIFYHEEVLPYSAMETLSDIHPLCIYAHKCSTSGANPYTFCSITGSDSLAAQVGLYKHMKSRFDLDESTKICDLTGGRGDFQYAMTHLGLRADTFSKKDTFTSWNHHPKVKFLENYDIKMTSTIKFITDYEIVHVDVSFTGSEELNILDLILLLESNNITYTIRLNSVQLKGYTGKNIESLPYYSHRIAYAVNRDFKPYQIYLIGTPLNGEIVHEGPALKSTVAFRAMALSFSNLLSPKNYLYRLHDYDPNSITVYFPKNQKLISLIKQICTTSASKEKLYYAKRYTSEIGDSSLLYWHEGSINKTDIEILTELITDPGCTSDAVYTDFSISNIGNVSGNSLPYHIKHLESLKTSGIKKNYYSITQLPGEFLDYMRTHHPLQSERTKCNIAIGCIQFLPHQFSTGLNDIKELIDDLDSQLKFKDTLNQREIQNAVKLLILSASKNEYAFGIKYCHHRISTDMKHKSSNIRLLRVYRLISCYYQLCQEMVHNGIVKTHEIHAISHDLEAREMKKLKTNYKTSVTLGDYMEDIPKSDIIELTFDDLFTNLENMTLNLLDSNEDTGTSLSFDPVTETANMNFDIGLEKILNDAIVKLQLNAPNKHGIIDLGDDYDEYDPE